MHWICDIGLRLGYHSDKRDGKPLNWLDASSTNGAGSRSAQPPNALTLTQPNVTVSKCGLKQTLDARLVTARSRAMAPG